MATENQAKKSPAQKAADSAVKAGNAAKAVGKAGAKAATGNYVGAAVELAKDKQIRTAIIGAFAFIILLVFGVFMMVGSAITGVIANLTSGVNDFIDAYNEAVEDRASLSGGNLMYLYSHGFYDVLEDAKENYVSTVIADCLDKQFGTNGADTSNTVLGGDSTNTSIDGADYDQTIHSIEYKDSLRETLNKRLTMIKNRVKERGNQLVTYGNLQYDLESIGLGIGEYLTAQFEDPILFNGIDLGNSSLLINSTAFELTDIQALKIYTAYCIQHDCSLEDVAFWDLMDYCGWYALEFEEMEVPSMAESLYSTSVSGAFTSDFCDGIESGDVISSTVYDLKAPHVPYWDGTFAPQWMYEEIAQIKANNELYDKLVEKGDTEALAGMTRYATDANGNIDFSRFASIRNHRSYGIIDKVYSSSTATLTVSRTEYHGADEAFEEALSKFFGAILDAWKGAYQEVSFSTEENNTVKRGVDNNHSFTVSNAIKGMPYYLVCGGDYQLQIPSEDGALTFTNLLASCHYTLQDGADEFAIILDEFTTLEDRSEPQAYELCLNLQVDYISQNIDLLLDDTIGLWPGHLDATEESDGKVYAAGHIGNENLLRYWTDIYTDENGVAHEIVFERLQGYQQESYKDMYRGLAKDLLGLFGNVDLPAMSESGWLIPVNYTRVASHYGNRLHPIYNEWRFHSGIDLAAPAGEPIFATRDGVVTTAAYNSSAGNFVAIDHRDGYESRYLHMTEYIVYPGQEVKAGDIIGYVGATGDATGPHLHFTILYEGNTVDPAPFLNIYE